MYVLRSSAVTINGAVWPSTLRFRARGPRRQATALDRNVSCSARRSVGKLRLDPRASCSHKTTLDRVLTYTLVYTQNSPLFAQRIKRRRELFIADETSMQSRATTTVGGLDNVQWAGQCRLNNEAANAVHPAHNSPQHLSSFFHSGSIRSSSGGSSAVTDAFFTRTPFPRHQMS